VFWEGVLPVVTLVLGYFGSLYTERWREERERERAVLNRIADIETEALIELQDLLITLPRLWSDRVDAVNRVIAARTPGRWSEIDRAEKIAASEARNRALALATRIADPDLSHGVREAILEACPQQLWGQNAQAVIDAGQPFEYPDSAVWRAVNRAIAEIGERLVLPPRRR
jgi:hypothetical protein